MPVTFNLDEGALLGDYLKTKNELALRRACLAAAHRLVQYIVTEVIPGEPNPPVDKTIYRASWRAVKTTEGADVFNGMPYAPIIERGARAANIKIGRKMIDALTEWVLRKGLAPKGEGGAQGGTAEARKIAWAIAKAFKSKGIYNKGKGLRILEKASKKVQQFLQEEYARELGRVF